MSRYDDMVKRLSERFITKCLEAGDNTIIAIDDLLDSYRNFAGMSPVITDDELIERIIARFPKVKIDYSKNTLVNLNWIRPKAEPPKPPVDLHIQQLNLRLETIVRLYPTYATSGFTALTFARFTKNSITSGSIKVEYGEIPIQEALDYLDHNSKCKKIENYYYIV